jgi:hypothetical protein
MVGILIGSIAAPPTPAAAQSHTDFWAGLSVGVFDGFGIGLTHYAHSGGIVAGVSVATGTTRYADYGIYDDDWSGRRYGDYRYGGYRDRGHADYCWDRSWDLRWGRRYYGWDWYGYPAYDHLDFYHDCLSGGVGYAYSRWGAHARRAHYAGYGRYHRGWGVSVQIYVTDPFWRPWGPYWAYDPWGWYQDGFRDGRRWGRYGPYAGWGPGVRTVWTEGRGGWGRPSPLGPGYKEDPEGGRTAVPRVGRTVAVSAPAAGERAGDVGRTAGARRSPTVDTRAGRPGNGGGPIGGTEAGARAPERGSSGGRTARVRPTDGLRTGSGVDGSGGGRTERPASAPPPEAGGRGDRAEPAAPRVRGSTRGGSGADADAPPALAVPRTRPSDGARAPDGGAVGGPVVRDRGGDEAQAPRRRGEGDVPVPRDRGGRSAEPRAEPTPSATRERPPVARPGGERPDPSARSGGQRSAPSARSGGGRSAPAVRSGGGERSAPSTRSDGGERSAPAARSGGQAAPRRRSNDEPR